MRDFTTMISEAKLPERTVLVCLRGDLAADHETAVRELDEAQRRPVDSLAGAGVTKIAERIAEMEAAMREHTYDFRLRALPRHTFRALLSGHPPRDGEKEDAAFGVNRDTFFPALIRASVIDPELTDEQWTSLLDEHLTDYQFQELAVASWALNAREVDIPFSPVASRVRQATAEG